MKIRLLTFTLLLLSSISLFAADGDFDTATFNSPSGFRNSNITTAQDVGEAILQQPDGKIVVSGQCNFRFCVIRYNTDGSLDSTFAGDGIAETTIPGIPVAVFLQPDSKIVTAASDTVVRFLADGLLDTSFGGGDGHVTVNFGIGGTVRELIAALLLPDGKIFAVGYRSTALPPPNNTDMVLVRFTADGILDTSFDGDGILISELTSPGRAQQPSDAVLTAYGKILVAGQQGDGGVGYSNVLLVRYNEDGSLDTSFDGDGWLMTNVFPNNNSFANSIALTPTGRIVVGGQGGGGEGLTSKAVMLRYGPDGVLDPSFDGDGILTPVNVGAFGDAVVQPDGKIVAVQQGTSGRIVKLNTNGSYDTTFRNGVGVTSLPGVRKVMVQTDGKVVATGTTATPSTANPSIFTARLLNTSGPFTASTVSVSGRVTDANGAGVRNANVVLTGGSLEEPIFARTSSFGYYIFDSLAVGETYVATVNSKRYTFEPRIFTLNDDLADLDFVAGAANFAASHAK